MQSQTVGRIFCKWITAMNVHLSPLIKVCVCDNHHFHLKSHWTTTAPNDEYKITKKIEMKPVLSKMHQNSAILAKNWFRIEMPTQAAHLPDLSWQIAITRPQK